MITPGIKLPVRIEELKSDDASSNRGSITEEVKAEIKQE